MSEYRAFQLFRYLPPEKTAADYSEVEKEQFRAMFSSVAKRERVSSRIILAMGTIGFSLMIFSKRDDRWWLFGGVIVSAIVYAMLFSPTCPACKKKISGVVKKFYPECGSNDLTPRGFMFSARCHSCGATLRQSKGRSYKIRCCTHCGVFLDGKGI
jgi:hypothetical protein